MKTTEKNTNKKVTKQCTICGSSTRRNLITDVYLSKEEFENDLDDCLTIISYPSKFRKYYVCEHISPALLRRKVRVFVNI